MRFRLSLSREDVQGGRTAADLMEHNALTAAQMLAQQFAAQFAQVREANVVEPLFADDVCRR